MDFEFDKEIDALLRQSAQSESVFTAANSKSQIPALKSAHLDADAISAFAENALPQKTKEKYTLHLADCDRCRNNLATLILLNADESSEIVQAEEKHFVAAPIPWYRKIFAFPNLAYAMGALVLFFSGIAVYVVLQSTNNSNNAEISQTYEKQSGKGMSSEGDAMPPESYSSNSAAVSNSMMSNMAVANPANSAANSSIVSSAPVLSANSNSVMRDAADKDLPAAPKSTVPAKEPMALSKMEDSMVAGAAPVPPPPTKESDFSVDGEAKQNQTQNPVTNNQTETMPDSRNVRRSQLPMLRADKSSRVEKSKDDAAKSKSVTAGEKISVGGKTFNRENNVWYDSAYRGQATVNVTRGTNEYKKLDSGLRGIAENLGGTVVVVWKQKAYRIQ